MLPEFNARTLFNTLRRITSRGCCLLLTLSLLAGTAVAQSEQETKRAEGTKLLNEAFKLYMEGTKDSLKQAIEKYEQSRPLFQSVNDGLSESIALNGLGTVSSLLGEKQKALEYYALALPLCRSTGNKLGEALALINSGGVYDDLGDRQKALENYALALPILRELRNRQGEALTYNNIGRAYNNLGERQKALDHYALALPIYREIKDRRGEAGTLGNIGAVYDDLGERHKALEYYQQALSVFQAGGDKRAEALMLNNIGRLSVLLGDKRKALDYFTKALALYRERGDRQGEAVTLSNTGSIYDDLSDRQKALEYFEQALPIFHAMGDRRGEAYTLNNLGRVYSNSNEHQRALEHLEQALPLFRAIGDPQGEALTLYNIAYSKRLQGNLPEARARIEEALTLVESLRTKITSRNLRASYFATVQEYYELYINLLMSLHHQSPSEGHDGRALQASERSRARALLEMLAEANADIRQGVDPELIERERALQRQLNTRAQEQRRLLSAQHTREQASAIATEIATLTTELQQVESQIRQTSPRYAALTRPEPLNLKEIQTSVLDPDTLLLEYSLGANKSYLWAVTQTNIKSYELPKRAEIESAARRVYELLNARNQVNEKETPAQERARIAQADAQYRDAAARLSQMVLAPVAVELGTKRLLIVSDGALQYIPFTALPGPAASSKTVTNVPLVVSHEIVNLPSASTISVLRKEVQGRKPAGKVVAVLADPVFDSADERARQSIARAGVETEKQAAAKKRELPLGMERAATESGLLRGEGLQIPRLPGTRDEATEILSLVPPVQRKGAFDFAASRQTASSAELAQYRYVHFATHGFLNSLHPELSGIVLSMVDEKGAPQDGFLRAHEVFNLKLPAELVVLSACQTGLGKEVKGEGLIGLTRGFMYAGAPRVVVSLWSVADDATAELMARFYRGMLKEKLRPVAALRAAQISLMREREWKSPFYWAAFTLQGEWR
ncbi:MAG TPA: tetratricopeptide repeat protein [Pyrinomonadaceae bacterium]|jgi:CHAT domain-containing protein